MRRLRALRTAVLVSSGSFALHQLRYLAGYGVGAGDELRRTGHSYLSGLGALLAALVLLVAGITIARMLRAGPPVAPGREGCRGRLRTWLGFALALLAIYATQESLEGVLASGHPGGLGALADGGGWTALPLAALIALPLALVQRAVAVLECRPAPWGGLGAFRALAAGDEPAPTLVVARTPRGGRLIAASLAKRPPPAALARPA